MSILGTTTAQPVALGTALAQAVAGAPAAERLARPAGLAHEGRVARGGMYAREDLDEDDVDTVQVSDEARSLKDAADEETRQERRGHDTASEPPQHGHESEEDNLTEAEEAEMGVVSEADPAAEPQLVHIDVQA